MSFAKMALALGTTIGARQALRSIQNYGVGDLLGTVGLERRRTAMDRLLPALGWIGVGTAIGAGVALLWAPSSGRELRAKMSEQLDHAKERIDNGMRSLDEAMPGHNGS